MFQNREGQNVPEVTFHTRAGSAWKDVTTAELFAGKTVVVFALPGAFTPTCSSAHVPRYNEFYDTFVGLGVDDILCVSVNDAFVMRQWGLKQGLREEAADGRAR
jgi:peroxiredoxin